MQIRSLGVPALIAFALLAALVACDRKPPPATGIAGKSPAFRIAVIPKGTTHVFWKGVESGAKRAGTELGVEIIWKGPQKEDDRAQQIALVDQFVTDKISAIVLAPLDSEALVPPVKKALDKGIPVAIIDSGLKGEPGKDYIGYFGTDNQAAGRLGGAHLAALMSGKGSAVVLRYSVGSASTGQREEGALEGLKGGGTTIALSDQYGEVTPESAKTKALQLLDTIKASQGVFTPNESTTMGMLLALRQSGLAGKIKFVGFDASPPLVEALRKGEIDALVVQNPDMMGYVGVQNAVRKLKGETPAASIDTGAVLVTRESMDKPEVKKLLP